MALSCWLVFHSTHFTFSNSVLVRVYPPPFRYSVYTKTLLARKVIFRDNHFSKEFRPTTSDTNKNWLHTGHIMSMWNLQAILAKYRHSITVAAHLLHYNKKHLTLTVFGKLSGQHFQHSYSAYQIFTLPCRYSHTQQFITPNRILSLYTLHVICVLKMFIFHRSFEMPLRPQKSLAKSTHKICDHKLFWSHINCWNNKKYTKRNKHCNDFSNSFVCMQAHNTII